MTTMSRRKPASTGRRPRPRAADTADWIHGRHAVLAALANPRRRLHRLMATEAVDADPALAAACAGRPDLPTPEMVSPAELAALLPPEARHQGLALRADPPEAPTLDEWLDTAGDEVLAVVLDQVTDPHNVGAIFRSAALFGAGAVITTDRHAPPLTGAVAKVASGAVELVPYIRVTNLARGLDTLQAAGFWCLGLDGAAADPLPHPPPTGRRALVLGAEGPGLRRLTRERCDQLVHIPMAGAESCRGLVDSLNVSNAAAVALYALARQEAAD